MNTSKGQDTSGYGRRVFLAQASALSAAALFGLPRSALAEPAPETTKIRLVHSPAICTAPEELAEELLRLEGFSEVEYVKQSVNSASALLATGQADIAMDSAPSVTFALGEGKPILALAGVHAGCYELFASGFLWFREAFPLKPDGEARRKWRRSAQTPEREILVGRLCLDLYSYSLSYLQQYES